MARPSKLTEAQCARIRELKTREVNPISAVNLAKMFKVSESSIYKVLDNTYVARSTDSAPAVATTSVAPIKPLGAMPSIFDSGDRSQPRRRASDHEALQPRSGAIAELLDRAAKADFDQPVDELTLAAARLVVAKAQFNKALAHSS